MNLKSALSSSSTAFVAQSPRLPRLSRACSLQRPDARLRSVAARENLRKPVVARHPRWLRAERSGIHRIEVKLGQQVRRGDRLGVISDPFGTLEDEVRAELDGIIIGQTSLPLINEGDALIHVARFDRVSSAERSIETTQGLIDHADTQLPDIEPPTY